MKARVEKTIEGVVAARACPGCGEPLETIAKFCSHCGMPGAGGTDEDTVAVPRPSDARALSCEGCGAEVTFGDGEISARCPFCDSPTVQRIAPEGVPPEFVIGFAVAREQATAAYESWLKQGAWYRPGDLARSARVDAFRGVYIPCWSFSALARSHYTAQIGEYWYRTETYTVMVNGKLQTRTRQVRETEWYPFGGGYHAWQSGYLVSASRGLPQPDFDAIKPYDTASMRRYDPAFLAGWAAEAPSIDRQQALETATAAFRERHRPLVAAHLPGDTHGQLEITTQFSDFADDLVFAPLWIAAYRYHDKVYRFLINGQTGRVHGSKPLSVPRILAAIAVGIALIAGVAFLIASAR